MEQVGRCFIDIINTSKGEVDHWLQKIFINCTRTHSRTYIIVQSKVKYTTMQCGHALVSDIVTFSVDDQQKYKQGFTNITQPIRCALLYVLKW